MSYQTQFINKIAPIIQAEAARRGYKTPSAIIAQACIESAWGQSLLASNYYNYFGMKCGNSWNGKSVNLNTLEEYKKGTLTQIRDNFRVFASMRAGVSGYFDFISTKRYATLKKCTTAYDYLTIIKKAGYATSSSYVNTCMQVVTKYHLSDYDEVTHPTANGKSKTDVAREVIGGKWGVGADRRARLVSAGYDYTEIQGIVNRLLRG